MKSNIKLVDKELPLPAYQTEKSGAFDLYSREDITFEPKEMKVVPLNICLQIPKNHVAILSPRSSLYRKHQLLLVNGIGIIDEDYCGNDDEYMAQLVNASEETQTIQKGERICQVLLLPITRTQFEQVDDMSSESRGRFGSTDK